MTFNVDLARERRVWRREEMRLSGVQPTFVVDACVKRPDLFRALTRNGEKAWAALELLVENCEITYEDAIRIFAR